MYENQRRLEFENGEKERGSVSTKRKISPLSLFHQHHIFFRISMTKNDVIELGYILEHKVM